MSKAKKKQQVSETKSPEEVYSEIDVVKTSTKPISFRVDSEVYRKIATLEKLRSEHKSSIIKEAIDVTFNRMMFNHINKELFEINKEIFPGIVIQNHFQMSESDNDEDEERNPFIQNENEFSRGTFSKCVVNYKLNYPLFESKNKGYTCSFNKLEIDLTTESSKNIKIRVSLRKVVDGAIDKIDPTLLIKIPQSFEKDLFQIETDTTKKTISQDIFFERRAPYLCSKWLPNYKKEMELLKKTIENIISYFETVNSLNKK